MHINPLVAATSAPPIPAVQAWMREHDTSAGPLIDLCQAVPGYAPPAALQERLAREAANPTNARYGPILGDPALQEAYAGHLAALYGTPLTAANVAVTAGCNQGFFAAVSAVAGRGDAVILPRPWYFNHEMTLRQLGIEARPLACREEQGFVPDPVELERMLTAPTASNVRAVVLVTPNNPTGAVYPAATIAAIAASCRRHRVWLILDETYRDFLPADRLRLHDILADADTPGSVPHEAVRSVWPEHVVQLYSFSKAYAVPGQRLGALAAPQSLLLQMTKILDCLHVCAQRPAQAAITWAIDGVSAWRDANRCEMNRRGDALSQCFAALPEWPIASQGAYFAYVRHPFRGTPDWQVVEHLATRHGIGCLPGVAFGGTEGFLRFAFANVDAAGLAALARRLGTLELRIQA